MTDHDAIAARVRQDRETGTPGPWQSGIIEDGGPFAVGDRDCWPICKMAAAPGPHNGANARRIAALPDLEAAYLDLYDEVQRLRAEKDAKQVKRTIPAGQTPLDDKLNHRFLDVIQEGEAARDAGTASPYHGHSLEHCLHATGWVMRDLRLALDEARARAEKAEAERIAEWNKRRDAESSLVLEKAVCLTAEAERDRLRVALLKIAEYLPSFDYVARDEFGKCTDLPGSPYDRGKADASAHLSAIARAALKGPEE